MRRPKRAATTLARGWVTDGRRWTLGSSLVLAATLIAMVGTAGLLDGTRAATLERVADFYTGDLRITPYRTGAIPGGWFDLNASTSGPGAVQEFAAAGVRVSPRVEAQYIMSRTALIANVIDTYGNNGQFPIETPGQSGEDANRSLAVGGLLGIEQNDPATARIAAHLVEGRMPRPTTDGTIEVAMSVSRLEHFLTPDERKGLASPPPLSTLCHRDALVRSTPCEITSAQTKVDAIFKDFVRRPVDVVGLFETGVDVLDSFTLVAPAPQVRELLGHPGYQGIANVLAVQSGSVAAAQGVAARHHWATEDATSFAGTYVGQLIAVLSAVVFIVGALLFLLPTFLVSHGIARQLALQQRELAVCKAIGVSAGTLRKALALQVMRIAGVGAGIAAVVTVIAALALPPLLANVKGTPLPAGFALTTVTLVGAVIVTVLAMAIGWVMGLRSRSRLPLTSQLRAA